MRHGRTIAGVALAVLAADAATKAVATHALAGRGAVHVAGDLHLLLYRNHGGPAGLLPGHPVLVSVLALVALGAMVAVARVVQTRLGAVAVGLMLGGGLGNLADRLLRAPGPLRGGVVDWIQPRTHGASMNLADLSLNAALAVGLLVLLAGAVRARRPGPAVS
ncbi:signal peptidase II [Baekduia soli]|uniref:Signal peptidase II n=1 Tax=Baekduia soli TaxID=496014 RepID=A0A5B8U938_9ACTN|nr:signal peptidase II [Baekduia soli]QEC49673.1 signal peptidase II [Baekduia soli]